MRLSLTGGLESRKPLDRVSLQDDSRKKLVLLALNSHNGELEGPKDRGQSVLARRQS